MHREQRLVRGHDWNAGRQRGQRRAGCRPPEHFDYDVGLPRRERRPWSGHGGDVGRRDRSVADERRRDRERNPDRGLLLRHRGDRAANLAEPEQSSADFAQRSAGEVLRLRLPPVHNVVMSSLGAPATFDACRPATRTVNRTWRIWRSDFRDRKVYRGSYLSRFIGQEVAPGLSRGLVAVASSGLFPQPLWISVRSERELIERMARPRGMSRGGRRATSRLVSSARRQQIYGPGESCPDPGHLSSSESSTSGALRPRAAATATGPRSFGPPAALLHDGGFAWKSWD